MNHLYLRDASISEGKTGSIEQILSAAHYAHQFQLGLEVTINDYFLETIHHKHAIKTLFNAMPGIIFHLHSNKNILADETKKFIDIVRFFHEGSNNIKGVIIHPEQTNDINHMLNAMKEFPDLYFGIETMQIKRYSLESLAARLERHKELSVVLDPSHLTKDYSTKEVKDFMKKYHDRIKEVHLSVPIENFDHALMHQNELLACGIVRNYTKGFKDVNYVIEGFLHTSKYKDETLRREIRFIKENVNGGMM